jgi:hypothetical protein
MRLRTIVCAVAAACASLLVAVGAAQAAPTVTTVVSRLDNPRDLDFSPGGRLYVAEAGHGGPECLAGGEEGTTCVGFTSGISRVSIRDHTSTRIVSGLISLADDTGSFATGVDGIDWRPDSTLFGIITAAPDAIPPGLSADTTAKAQQQLGQLITTRRPFGKVQFVAGVGHTDFQWSLMHKSLVPDQFPDANPYGVIALPAEPWVVDAGSNTLDRIGRNGPVVVKFIPNPPSSDAVPTCIDRGPDGALYIGQLTGGGNVPGAASIWRFSTHTGSLTKWATGLTAITGCGFDASGTFYATEFSTLGLDNAAPGTGALVRVPPHSTSPVPLVSNLDFPGGFAARGDGSLYVSNWSIAPAKPAAGPSGEVVRIRP